MPSTPGARRPNRGPAARHRPSSERGRCGGGLSTRLPTPSSALWGGSRDGWCMDLLTTCSRWSPRTRPDGGGVLEPDGEPRPGPGSSSLTPNRWCPCSGSCPWNPRIRAARARTRPARSRGGVGGTGVRAGARGSVIPRARGRRRCGRRRGRGGAGHQRTSGHEAGCKCADWRPRCEGETAWAMYPFVMCADPLGPALQSCAPRLCAPAQRFRCVRRGRRRSDDDSQEPKDVPSCAPVAHSACGVGAQRLSPRAVNLSRRRPSCSPANSTSASGRRSRPYPANVSSESR